MGRGYLRKRFYSTPQRILIHLSTAAGTEQGADLYPLTQEGIGGAILSARPTATKWLKQLQARGWVAREREHVPGYRVRKTVYRLTDLGWSEAHRLRRRLAEDVVEVRAPGVDRVSMRVEDIPRLFPTQVNLIMAVSLIRQGRIDLSTQGDSAAAESAVHQGGHGLRRIDRVFGRSEELRFLDRWTAGPSTILAVVGLQGIGKSTLVASWVLRRRPRARVFWFDMEEGTTPQAFLMEFGAFLARSGRRSLATDLIESGGTDLRSAIHIVAREISDLQLLLVIDNLQMAGPDMMQFIAGPLLGTLSQQKRKAILLSRTSPSFLHSAKSRRTRGAEVLRLGGLELDASIALLRARGLAADDVTMMEIAASTRGHPLVIALAAQSGSVVAPEVRRFFEAEIWRSLSTRERALLEAASVFRRFAPLTALRGYFEATDSALAALDRKDLITPTFSDTIVVHDTIRDFVLNRLEETTRRRLHERAARYFLGRLEPGERAKALYHLVRAGQAKRAMEFLASEGPSLFESTPAYEISSLLREIAVAALDPPSACILEEVRGDSFRIMGDVEAALLQYRHTLRRCRKEAKHDFLPRILRKIATIERRRNEYARALRHLEEAKARLEGRPNPAELAEVLREMALVENVQGDFSSARRHLNLSVNLADEASDPGSISRSLLALGLLEAGQGSVNIALQHKLQGLRVSERAGNLAEVARACISIGTAYWDLGRLEECLTYEERGLHLARLLGNLRLIAYASMNRAAVLADLRRYEDAVVSMREARELFQILGEEDSLAMLAVTEGDLEKSLGHHALARRIWEGALLTLRRIGDPYDLMRTLRWIGESYLHDGDAAGGQACLEEAGAIARRLGNEPMTADIEVQMAGQRIDVAKAKAPSQG